MQSLPKIFKVFCYLSVLGSSYLASLNFSSYYNANEVDVMQKEISREIEMRFSQSLNGISEQDADKTLEMVQTDLEQNLTVPKYKKHSLFRIVGNLITMIGAYMMLRLRSFGYHLYIAGTVFLIITGFTSLGFSLMGWSFNMFYILVGFGFGIFYTINRKWLIL
jgi:hypothetical protein